jgi:O-antigen ligase
MQVSLFNQTQLRDPSVVVWTHAIPIALLMLPFIAFVSFRINSWFPSMVPLIFLISFGPLAYGPGIARLSWRFGLTIAMFALWLLSALMSAHALKSVGVIAATAVVLFTSIGFFIVMDSMPASSRARCRQAFLTGYVIGLVLLALLSRRIITAVFVHGEDGEQLYGYQRGAVTLVVFLPVALAYIYSAFDLRRAHAWSALLVACVTWVSWETISETAKIAAPICAAVFATAFLFKSWALRLSAVGLIAVFLVWPFVMPPLHAALLNGSLPLPNFGSAHRRLEMWADAARFTFEAPWFGHGPHTLKFDLQKRAAFRDYHAHSGIATIWLDLGIAGIAATLTVLMSMLSSARSMPAPLAAAVISATVTVCTAHSVSHGLWQAWWLATAGAVPGLLLLFEDRANNGSERPSPSV